VLDDSNPPFYTWFADGTINVSYNCLDRHVLARRGDRVAFYWRGEEGEERELTYAELLDSVQRLANALKARGIGKGDIVGIYLPMIPEVVVAMLACAHRRATHRRLRRFRSRRGARAAGGLAGQGTDRRGRGSAQGQVHPCQAAGRRGDSRPAGPADGRGGQVNRYRVRDATGAGRVVRRADRRRRPGLPRRADAGRASIVPALLPRLHREAEGDLAHVGRLPLGTVGEPINPKAWLWYHVVIGGERCPIVDTWWQTETGAIMISTLPGVIPAKPGSAGLPLPGVSAALVDESGGQIEHGSGLPVLTRPWPSMLRTSYNDPDRYVQT
jgi:acyl-CoA synthetase (AMP-forming)/AMP-acid ligase II